MPEVKRTMHIENALMITFIKLTNFFVHGSGSLLENLVSVSLVKQTECV